MLKRVRHFLEEYHITDADINLESLVAAFISEMKNGLEGKNSSLRMIPTFIEAENRFRTGVAVTAIDAGGTNFRAANVHFTDEGKLVISETVKQKMPGLNGPVSKEKFFELLAGYVKELAKETGSIGFCFSYPTEIFPNKDGKLLEFSKEIQAPEVIGEMIGQNLLRTLGMKEKEIVLLNDTVATLLAGKSASFEQEYDSYIGFILGTGTNTAYIESNDKITKESGLEPGRSQIINIESGAFASVPRSKIDFAFDEKTVNPGKYPFEKMISGGYFGGLAHAALKIAANEGVLSSESSENILAADELTTEDVDRFLEQKSQSRGPLMNHLVQEDDRDTVLEILQALVSRAAKMVAANLAAVILKTGRGKKAAKPVLITVEGTAYYELHGLKSEIESVLNEFLSGKNQRYYQFTHVDQSSLVGAALAALIE
jgi:hexokinase